MGVSYDYMDYNGFLCIKNIGRDLIDLDKTFECGQCFRWEKLADGTWIGVVNNKIFMLKHKDINGVPCIITNSTLEDWKNILVDYLDLNYAYNISIPDSDKFAKQACEIGKGIRILKQDPWETLISFIISQRNNIPKIKTTISKLCNRFGDIISIKVNGVTYTKNTFPSKQCISKLSISDLDGLGLGYRDRYIIEAANSDVDVYKLRDSKVSSEVALNILQSLYGVGPKVANCVALFGLHKLDVFPIDVWMQRIIDQYYNGDIDIKSYGSLAGLIQQYMFYTIRFFEG